MAFSNFWKNFIFMANLFKKKTLFFDMISFKGNITFVVYILSIPVAANDR